MGGVWLIPEMRLFRRRGPDGGRIGGLTHAKAWSRRQRMFAAVAHTSLLGPCWRHRCLHKVASALIEVRRTLTLSIIFIKINYIQQYTHKGFLEGNFRLSGLRCYCSTACESERIGLLAT